MSRNQEHILRELNLHREIILQEWKALEAEILNQEWKLQEAEILNQEETAKVQEEEEDKLKAD